MTVQINSVQLIGLNFPPQIQITGSGFGSSVGTVVISDESRGWEAGGSSDPVQFTFGNWNDTNIGISNISNYAHGDTTNFSDGQGYWTWRPNDSLIVTVTNTTTGESGTFSLVVPSNFPLPSVVLNPVGQVPAGNLINITGNVSFNSEVLPNVQVMVSVTNGTLGGTQIRNDQTQYEVTTDSNGNFSIPYTAPTINGGVTVIVSSCGVTQQQSFRITQQTISLGGIDLSTPLEYPVYYIVKPDGTTVAKIKDSLNITLDLKLSNTNQIQFDVPYQVLRNGQSIRNPIIDLIRERYLMKLVFNGQTEWFLIEEVDDKMADSSTNSGDIKTVTAYSLNYELANKLIMGFDAEGINLTTAIMGGQVTNSSGNVVQWEGALSNTLWGLGYVDSGFDEVYMTFKESNVNSLDLVTKIAQAFNAIIVWDTNNRLVNFYQEENIGVDRGLRLSYDAILNSQKYLDSYEHDSKTDQLVTRLHVYGANNISINSVNPTGSDYIEDYSYFMQGFEVDASNNIVGHSKYMSDSLCLAITNYQSKVKGLNGVYTNLLDQLSQQQSTLTSDQNNQNTLQTNVNDAQQLVDSFNASTDNKISSLTFNATGSQNATLNGNYYYVVFAYADGGAEVSINSTGTLLPINKWTVIRKINATASGSSYSQETDVTFNGATNVKVIYEMIFNNEYVALNNDDDLLLKYCVGWNTDQLNAQLSIVNVNNSAIASTEAQIASLQQQLDVTSNFTQEQLEEWNYYIIESTLSDSSWTDPKSMYEQALQEFAAMTSPQIVYQIELANFLEDVKAQREWDKLLLGDIVTIDVPYFNQNQVKAKMVEINYDFENGTITLSLANVVDIRTGEYKFLDMLYQNVSTSTSVNLNSYKWDNAYDQSNAVANTINSTWDATKREITAGINESVTINNRGITITDPTNPNHVLIAQAGVLAVSGDGGNTWKHAIRWDGIVGESIYGVLLAGENLIIENTAGTMTIDGTGITVSGETLTITGGLPISQIDQSAVGLWNQALQPDVAYNGVTIDSVNGLIVTANTKMQRTIVNATQGFAIQKNTGSASSPTWENVFLANPNGDITADGLTVSNISIITGDPTPQVLIDGKNKVLNFSGFTEIQGQIMGDNLNAKGLVVQNTSGQTTFSVDNNGNVTISGNVTMQGGSISWGTGVNTPDASQINYDTGQSLQALMPAQVGADVTAQNTARDTENVNGVPASTITTAVSDFNSNNDMNPLVPPPPSLIQNPISSNSNSDGSVNITFQWQYSIAPNTATDIDGFIVYVYASNSSSSYTIASGVGSNVVTAFVLDFSERSITIHGVPCNDYYTFGVLAYRRVYSAININGIIKSSIAQSATTGQNPYQPFPIPNFTGNLNGMPASVVSSWAYTGGTYIDGSKIMTGSILANQITTGQLNANLIYGGTITLGGSSGTAMSVLNPSGNQIMSIGSNGMFYKNNTGNTLFSLEGSQVAIGDPTLSPSQNAAYGIYPFILDSRGLPANANNAYGAIGQWYDGIGIQSRANRDTSTNPAFSVRSNDGMNLFQVTDQGVVSVENSLYINRGGQLWIGNSYVNSYYGYTALPNGMLLQWTTMNVYVSGKGYFQSNFNFPISFSQVFNGQATLASGNGGSGGNTQVTLQGLSSGGGTIVVGTDWNIGSNVTVYVMAVGKA